MQPSWEKNQKDDSRLDKTTVTSVLPSIPSVIGEIIIPFEPDRNPTIVDVRNYIHRERIIV